MMKLVCCLALIFLAVCQTSVANDRVHVIEYQQGGSRVVDDMFFARGICRYRFTSLHIPPVVTVNITFEFEILSFVDFDNWKLVDSSPGFWYFSESKSQYNSGQPVFIEFDIRWDMSQGSATPNGTCETNLGHIITTTTSPP